MPNKILTGIYENLKKDGFTDIGKDISEFSDIMKNANNQKKVFDYIKTKNVRNMPKSLAEFSERIGVYPGTRKQDNIFSEEYLEQVAEPSIETTSDKTKNLMYDNPFSKYTNGIKGLIKPEQPSLGSYEEIKETGDMLHSYEAFRQSVDNETNRIQNEIKKGLELPEVRVAAESKNPYAVAAAFSQNYGKAYYRYRKQDIDAYKNYSTANNLITEAKKTANASKNKSGFWKGVGDNLLTEDAVTLGLSTFRNTQQLKSLLDKVEKEGIQSLTPSENTLLEAASVKSLSDMIYESGLSTLYNVGSATGTSIPYMLQFVITHAPASAIAKPVMKKLTGYVTKRFGEAAIKKAAARAISTLPKVGTKTALKTANALAKTGVAALEAGATGALMPIIQPSMYNDILERRMGQVDADINPQTGKVQYKGQTGEKSWGKSIGEGFTAGAIENLAEMSGGAIMKTLGVPVKALSKISPKSREFINIISEKPLLRSFNRVREDIAKTTGVHSIPGEALEEFVGQTANALTVGDQKLEDIYTWENAWMTLASVAPLSIGMGSASGVMAQAAKKKVVRDYNRASKKLSEAYSPDLVEYIKSRVGGSPEQQAMIIRQYYDRAREAKNEEEKRNIANEYRLVMDYAAAVNNYDAYIGGIEARVANEVSALSEQIRNDINPDMNATVYIDYDGQMARVTSGNIVFDENGDINDSKSDDTITIELQDGTKQMVSPDKFKVTGYRSFDDQINEATQNIENTILSQEDTDVYGPDPVLDEALYINTDNGPVSVKVTRADYGGFEGIQIDESGKEITEIINGIETPVSIPFSKDQIIRPDNPTIETENNTVVEDARPLQAGDVINVTGFQNPVTFVSESNGDAIVGLLDNAGNPIINTEGEQVQVPVKSEQIIHSQTQSQEIKEETSDSASPVEEEVIPMRKNKKGEQVKDYVSMPDNMFVEHMINDYGNEAAKEGLKDRKRNIDSLINRLKKRRDKSTNTNEKIDIDDEINDLKSRLQILEELSQNLPNEPNSFKERLNSLSEPVSLEDYILQGIASGEYKFKWGGKNGLSDELGLKSDRERRSRIGILKNDGYTPETLAERIFQEIESGQLPFSVEELEIRNSIIDILNRVHSRKRALEESESLQKEFEDQQIRAQEQNSDVVEELTPEELQEIDDAIAELKPIDDIRFRTKETWTPEEKEIITKAKNNGTYLKAPNSADTNLNPRQWVQVRTKAFKKWFGDWENDSENVSKVVDENGEPMVVYHGTSNKSFFHIFDYNKAGTGNDKGLYSRGFYFSPNKRTADAYRGKEGHVYGVYLQLKNPFYINKFKNINELADYLNVSETIFYEHSHGFTVSPSFAGTLTSSIKEKGHDGVIVIRKNSDIIQEIVAFNPNQIKSATDNTGEFSINNNDIRFRTNMSSSSENLNNETLNNRNKNTALFNIESINDFAGMTPEQKIVFNAVIDMLKDANIPVEVLTNNQINSLVELQNSRLMTVYHGSGAKFDAFDHSHIGEGEGAQAYGWGSYVTEVEGIGRTYAESNSGNIFKSGFGDFYLQEIRKGLAEGNQFEDIKQKLLSYHADMYEKAGGNTEMYGDFISDYETLQQLKENDLPKRNLYTVEIPDNTGNNYLVWNEEVNETQKEEIISSLSEIYDEDFDFDYFLDKMDQYEYEYNLTGEGLYKLLSKYGFNNNPQKASNILQQIGYTGISYPAQYRTGGRSDGAKNYVIFNENDLKIKDRISFFKDNKGIIYGATINGEIYLNGSALNPETPIHEYTHIWDYACKENNPELWDRGIKLMKQTTVWEEVKNDPNYSDLQTDDEIASEVHSRLTGKDSTKLMEDIVSKASRKSSLEIVKAISLRENLKKWISDFWWWLKDTMSPWTKNKSSKVSLEDFVNMPLKDLVIGTKLNIKINHKSFKTQNKNNLLNNEDNSLSSQNDQKEKNGTISESIPQRKYGTQASQDRRMEEAASGLRNRIEASTRDAQKNSGTLSKRQQQEIEQRSAESYAKETGQWIPISDTFTWQPMPSGNENDVYLNTNDGHVYKVNNLINSKGIIPLFDRLILHNQTFPESKYEFVGFTGFDNGNIFPVFRQQYVNNATFATPQEIGEYMQSLGFKQTGDAKYSNGDITISDLRPRNVLKDSDGDLYVVDAEFKAENNSRFRFIGEEGATNLDRSEEATTRLDNLNVAREMENAFEEKKARIEKLRNSEPVEITGEEYKGKYELNRDSAQEFILNNLRSSYTIVDTGEKVNLSKVGAKKVTSHSMGNEAHLKSIVAIPQLLGNAIFIEERPNEKRNGKYDSYRYYVTGLKIGNENFTVRLTIGVKNGKYYYDHYLTEIEKGNLIEIANGFIPTEDAPVPSYTVGEDTRLISLLQTNDQENARKIKLATGWERGADGKWRYEVEDFDVDMEGLARKNSLYANLSWSKEYDTLIDKLLDGVKLSKEELSRFDELSEKEAEMRKVYEDSDIRYLDDYVKDKKLFESYPELKHVRVEMYNDPSSNTGATWYDSQNLIRVNESALERADFRSILTHEVQHAIQNIEGFARGGNSSTYRKHLDTLKEKRDAWSMIEEFDRKKKELGEGASQIDVYNAVINEYMSDGFKFGDGFIPSRDAFDNGFNLWVRGYDGEGYENAYNEYQYLINKFGLGYSNDRYKELSGEVEARNVSRRMNMTMDERRKSLASETEDVAREDQIFLYDNMINNSQAIESQIPKEEKINEIKRLSDILNTEVEIYDTQADLPTNIREKANGEISGYYMPGNDKVAIVLDANTSIGDIQATMLHEIVGHKGIRGLFGNRTDEFLDKVFESMDANVRAEYMERFNSERLAAEEYLSELAEYNPETSGIKKIIAIIRDFFREILGIDLKLSDNDIVYILSKSRERLQNSRNLSENKPLNESYSPNEESNLTNTKISEELKHIQQETEETLYRLKYPVKVDVSGDSAIEAAEKISGAQYLQRVIDKDIYRNISYNTLNRNAIQAVGYGRKKLRYFDKRKMENAYKGLFDNMNDLHNLQKTIIDTYGSIDDSLNAYYAENASSSRAQDRTNRFQIEYEQPLINTLAKIRKKFNNDDFMMKYYPSVRTIIERQKVITDREIKKAQNDPKIKDDRQSLFAAIQLAEKKDYAGQTGTYKEILAHEYPEFKFPANFETMTYDEVKDFAKENNLISMADFVERSENILGNDLVNEFWNNIRKISQYKLYNDYQTGMISRDMFEELTYGVTMKELAKKRLDAGEIKQEQYDLVLNTFNRPESLLSRGIITKDQYNSLKPRYEYYLPLKGTSDVEADDINEYNNKKVKNISALKAVEGHENVARDPLPQLLQDVYGSIMSQEQNRWRNTLLNMLRKYPMPDLYHIQTEYFTPIRNEKGNIIEYIPYVKIVNDKLIFVPTDEELKAKTAIHKRKGLDLDIEINKRQSSEHAVTFLENGDYVTVYFTDPRIAQSINNLNVNTLPTFLDSIMKWGGKINRFRSQFMTTANPEFVIANVIKDFQEANSNILIKEGLKYWKEFNKIYLNPELGAAIRRRLNGKKGDTEIDKYVDEFFKYGGETAYNMLPGYEQKRKDLYKEIKKINKEGNKAILVGSKVKDWAKDNLEMLNKQAELRARIATYVTSRKHTKREISRSIWDAKEITVNFDKRGSWAKGFGFWQLFWNAGRQSNRMQIQMIKTHPGKWAIVKSINATIGFVETVLPWLILDDDDRKNYLDKYFSITPYLRYSNLIMGFGGELVTIPLPPAFIPSHTLGVCMAEMVLRNNEPGFDPTALVIDVANAGANEWLPEFIVDPVFDIANRKDFVISSIVPAQLKPFAEIYDNRNFFGSPIYNDNINEFKPAYQRIYNGTGPTYVNISQTLNNWTGGNEVDRGFIQLNPAILEHLVEGYVSGLGKFGEKAFTTLSGNAESSKDIPVLGRFWRGDIEYYLDRDEKNTYYRLLKQAEEYRYRRNEYRKLNGYESEKEELKKEGELYEPILIQIRKLNRYKRLEKNTSDPKKKEKYKNKQNEVYKKVQQIEEEYNNKKFNQ